ncbi:hypothetical protein V9T40_004069 [Parthenolecanium corni]|uniref:Latrophilin Cirl n=1 Tax=Parthenolecanium corni TaxID=536013 RepID=A0AAN9TVH3_9HEMI
MSSSETLAFCVWAVVLVLLFTKMILAKDHAEYSTTYACDEKMLKIECNENHVINIIRANYGRYSIAVCNDNGSTDWSVNCMSHRSLLILQGRCNSKQNCSIAASTSLFDDPCPGTMKYLEAQYTCINATSSLSVSRPNPPWLITSPPTVWISSRFAFHSETSAVVSSSSTSAITSSSTKSTPNDKDSLEIDWAVHNISLSPVESKTSIINAISEELASSTERQIPDHNEKEPMCRPIVIRNLTWNWTSGGKVSVQPCPGGAVGLARWRCQTISDNLAVRFPDTPDLSECRSMWLNSLESRIGEQDSLIKIAADLSQVTESKILFGGDLLMTVKIIRDLAQKMENDIRTFSDYQQREAMVYELLLSNAQVSSNLLDVSQHASWKDLSYKEQVQVASSLLIGLEENSFLLAEITTREKIVTHCLKNILLSVQVFDIEHIHNKQFPILFQSDDCTQKVNSWLQLHESSLIENSDSNLVRLVYAAFDTLHQVLEVQAHGKEEKVINSKVLSASLGKGRHIHLTQPVTLCLQHLRLVNVSNPTCVFWDYTQNLWSDEGCSLITTNETHTICHCSHLTSFAIMVDIHPMLSGSLDRSLSTLTLLLSLVLVFLLVLLVSIVLILSYLCKEHSEKEYGSAASGNSKWFQKCFGCCWASRESKKTLSYKEPQPSLYGNATVQSMTSVVDDSGTICETRIVPHTSNTVPILYMPESTLEEQYPTLHLKLNHYYPTYSRNGSNRKMREARRLEHLENTLQHRNKKLVAGSLRSNSPRSHTYSEIAAASQQSDPIYEEIGREQELCSQVSDISDEEAKRISDMSRQSSNSYSDHRPLIPYNSVTDQNFHAALDAAYRQQLMEHNAKPASVLDRQTVVCHLQQLDPHIYHESMSYEPPHH